MGKRKQLAFLARSGPQVAALTRGSRKRRGVLPGNFSRSTRLQQVISACRISLDKLAVLPVLQRRRAEMYMAARGRIDETRIVVSIDATRTGHVTDR